MKKILTVLLVLGVIFCGTGCTRKVDAENPTAIRTYSSDDYSYELVQVLEQLEEMKEESDDIVTVNYTINQYEENYEIVVVLEIKDHEFKMITDVTDLTTLVENDLVIEDWKFYFDETELPYTAFEEVLNHYYYEY